MRAAVCALLTLLALAASAPAAAKKVYRVVDADGHVQYTDRAPETAGAAQVRVIPVQVEPSTVARLRVAQDGQRFLAYGSNGLAGPVEVELRFGQLDNMRSLPDLPWRWVLPAHRELMLATLLARDPAKPGRFQLRFVAVPGDPNARPEDVEYLLPVDTQSWRIDQGYGGGFSHDDEQNRYAVDFAVPEGTPVLVARPGIVMQVESDFERAGLDREKFAGRANVVRVLHDDGSMAIYAHLQPEGVTVLAGQRVRASQRLGYSGNTGYSSGPHLHFAVQVNRGMRLVSLPFRLRAPDGPVAIPGAP